MSDTIYWAILLDNESVSKLLSRFPPIHPNVYAEHMTVAFSPTKEQEEQMKKDCGKKVVLNVVGYGKNDKGQAVVVEGYTRLNKGIAHITISCAAGVKPVYSNSLLEAGYDKTNDSLSLNGVVARYSKSGWDTRCK